MKLTEQQQAALESAIATLAGRWEADELKDHLSSALATEGGKAEPFQARVQPWLIECFGEVIAGDREERNHRFFEEAGELVQACGMSASEAHQLVDYVWNRPVGEKHQEVGGVMVTLAALCLANGLDMHAAGETELARIWTKVEAIRAKQAAKPKHSPLPEHVSNAPAQSIADTAGKPNSERGQFEAWIAKEWPGFFVDRAPLMGFYKGDDGARIGDMWDGWCARASITTPPAPSVALCSICNGYGRWQDGHSGTEADGYAPNIVECECTDEERRPEYRQSAPSVADAAGAKDFRERFDVWRKEHMSDANLTERLMMRQAWTTAIEECLTEVHRVCGPLYARRIRQVMESGND